MQRCPVVLSALLLCGAASEPDLEENREFRGVFVT